MARVETLRLFELLPLHVELVHLAVGDGVVVERDGELRIELLGALVDGDRRGEVAVQEVAVAEVHVRAGGVADLLRVPVVHLRLLVVPLLQLQVAEEDLHQIVVGNERRELLHPAQRLRVIRRLGGVDVGRDDRVVDAGRPRCGAVERDRQRRDDQREEDDQRALDLVRVAEEDDEPVEDEPHRTQPEEQRQEQQREGEHGDRAAVEALPEELAEVVPHRARVADEERDREDRGG